VSERDSGSSKDRILKIITQLIDMQKQTWQWRLENKRIGLVPTMGYLHEGHLSLVRRARLNTDVVILSVFVNPIQFNSEEEFNEHPRDLKRDEELANSAGVDVLFVPTPEDMYPEGFASYVKVEKLTEGLCGKTRPGHFQGVTTVITKLFNIIQPDVALFGAKHYQQATVIKRMVEDLNFPVAIDVAPIIREANGLALSSRNQFLSPEEHAEALILYQSLRLAEYMIHNGERRSAEIVQAMEKMIDAVEHSRVEYIEMVHPETLDAVSDISEDVLVVLAVYIGKTRLTDNLLVRL
jgi:pantoate--beta-alanine ligase